MTRPVVDDGLRLDVHRVVVAAIGHRVPVRWSWRRDGVPIAHIVVAVTMHGSARGTLALTYRCNGVPFNQHFPLQAEPCRFGGQRWFARCPVTGRRAAKLYSLGGAGFHARARYGCVAYRTQRAPTAFDRVLMRRDRILFQRLNGDDPDFVPKPKWMRWKTYDRLMAQLSAAEAQLDEHLAGLLARLDRRRQRTSVA